MSVYIEEMSSDSRFFTEAEANRVGRSIVEIHPSNNQSSGVKNAVKFLEDIHSVNTPGEKTFEVVYDSTERQTTFQMSIPQLESDSIEDALSEKYDDMNRIVNRSQGESMFQRAEENELYVGAVEFELAKDVWYPIKGINISDFDDDPLHSIIRKITNDGTSTVSSMLQFRFKPVKQSKVLTRFSAEALVKYLIRKELPSGLYKYSYEDRINEIKSKLDYDNDMDEYTRNTLQKKKSNLIEKCISTESHPNYFYEVEVSLLCVGIEKTNVENKVEEVYDHISNKTKNPETGQKLTPKESESKSDFVKIVNKTITRRLESKKTTLQDLWRPTRTSPVYLSHTSLSEFVHLTDPSEIADSTIKVDTLGDDGFIPPEDIKADDPILRNA